MLHRLVSVIFFLFSFLDLLFNSLFDESSVVRQSAGQAVAFLEFGDDPSPPPICTPVAARLLLSSLLSRLLPPITDSAILHPACDWLLTLWGTLIRGLCDRALSEERMQLA